MRAIERARDRLQRDAFPRTLMALIVALTGLFGLLSSFAMLTWGLDSMVLRYPAAVLLAYLFFLLLLWAWLRSEDIGQGDVPLPDAGGQAGNGVVPEWGSGGGGDFGGGGASASWEVGQPTSADADVLATPLQEAGKLMGAAAEGEELAIPLMILTLLAVLLVGLLFASVYVVWIAPTLLAEVLVDGALAYALLRHLRGEDPQHWLATAVRRSVQPFVMAAVLLSIAGAVLQWAAPGSRSLGQAIEQLRVAR